MEAKLRQNLPQLRRGRLAELHPNPLADNFGESVGIGRTLQEKVQNLRGRQLPVVLPGFGINRQAIVLG